VGEGWEGVTGLVFPAPATHKEAQPAGRGVGGSIPAPTPRLVTGPPRPPPENQWGNRAVRIGRAGGRVGAKGEVAGGAGLV
jgi:hypothetical protein